MKRKDGKNKIERESFLSGSADDCEINENVAGQDPDDPAVDASDAYSDSPENDRTDGAGSYSDESENDRTDGADGLSDESEHELMDEADEAALENTYLPSPEYSSARSAAERISEDSSIIDAHIKERRSRRAGAGSRKADTAVTSAACDDGGDGKDGKKKKKKMSRGGRIAIICALVVLAAALVLGGIYINNIINRPEQLFNDITSTPAPTSAPAATAAVPGEPTATAEPELSDYEKLMQTADTSLMKDIVNVLLVGVDYAEERSSQNPNWTGKTSFHADVMIVLAINFKENTADMISIPRDTFANIPGVDGIYKINASLDLGGGFPDGFNKVMESAEWMLGGIPVDYYYAVTMPACKGLVDAIGGVDYDLEMDFTLAGRSYTKGQQHMDGQAVLDYLRVRKNDGKSKLTGGTGDLNRINRQKDMLVAIFKKLKSQNMLASVPQIIDSFDGQLFTNTNLGQTAALALFGLNLDDEKITMRSMGGTMKNVYNWNFCLTDQKKRVSIIEDVYGIKVNQYEDYTPMAIRASWQERLAPKYMEVGKPILDAAAPYAYAPVVVQPAQPQPVQPAPTAAPTAGPAAPTPDPAAPTAGPAAPTPDPAAPTAGPAAPTPGPAAPTPDPGAGVSYRSADSTSLMLLSAETDAMTIQQLYQVGQSQYAQLQNYGAMDLEDEAQLKALEDLTSSFKEVITSLAAKIAYPLKTKDWTINYEKEENEIFVDFR